jgi:hypothetical protein
LFVVLSPPVAVAFIAVHQRPLREKSAPAR